MEKRKVKRRVRFGAIVFLYALFLLIVGAFMILGVYTNMMLISKNEPQTFIRNALSNLSDDEINALYAGNETYETGNTADEVRAFFKDADYTVKRSSEGEGLYKLKYDDQEIAQVTLNSTDTKSFLGLISYDLFEMGGVTANESKSLLSTTITAPSTYTVTVNGVAAVPTSTSRDEDFVDAYNYVALPETNVYEISNLTHVPEIVIQKDGQNADFEMGKTITVEDNTYPVYNSLEEAGIDFDAMSFAKNWSLFMTNDLNGYSAHGLGLLSQNLIEGTQMYDRAAAWAWGPDITFTSVHTLAEVPFTNESISNVVKYSGDAFKVDVHVDKTMYIGAAAMEKVDTFNSTLYVIRYADRWNVVNMVGVKS